MKNFDNFYNSLNNTQRKEFNKYLNEREAERTRHTWATCILTAVAATTFAMYMFTLNITGISINNKKN